MAIHRCAIALTVLVGVLVAACQSEGRTFQTTLQTEYNNPLPVTLSDETGLVTGIAQAGVDPATSIDVEPAVHAAANDENASVLTWLGGACDQDTTVTFVAQNGGYVLSVAVHEKLGTGCSAVGVPRAIRIATSRPMPVNSVTVAGG